MANSKQSARDRIRTYLDDRQDEGMVPTGTIAKSLKIPRPTVETALEGMLAESLVATAKDDHGKAQWCAVPNEDTSPNGIPVQSEAQPETDQAELEKPASQADRDRAGAQAPEAATAEAATSRPETPNAASDQAASEVPQATVEDSGTTAADQGKQAASSQPKSAPTEPIVPDTTVLLVASALDRLDSKARLDQIVQAAFPFAVNAATEAAVLHALCALGANGAITCTNPFAPDDRGTDREVHWWAVSDDLPRAAATTRLTDAQTCAPCQKCATGPRKPRGKVRPMLATLVAEHPGEALTVGDFIELARNDTRFSEHLSANPRGAIQAALDQLALKKYGELVSQIPNVKPLTWRCKDADA